MSYIQWCPSPTELGLTPGPTGEAPSTTCVTWVDVYRCGVGQRGRAIRATSAAGIEARRMGTWKAANRGEERGATGARDEAKEESLTR